MMTTMIEQMTKEEYFDLIMINGVDAFNQFRRDHGYEFLDLSGLDFTGKDLGGINLSNTQLSNCRFDFSYLADASFIMAEMQHVSCREAHFFMSSFEEAIMTHADLYGSVFDACNLSEVVFTGAQAETASFRDCNLTDAKLNKTHLNDADFTGANLAGTDFTGADMEWAILDEVKVSTKTIWSNRIPGQPSSYSLESDTEDPEDDYAEEPLEERI
jgi:uncharacterized protein YjbI with pentapeptide repeats